MNVINGQTAHREYANRPADERYPSVQAMITAAVEQKDHSREVHYNLKDLQVVPVTVPAQETDGPPQAPRTSLMLRSPKADAKFTHWSFGQLCASLKAPAGYLRRLDPTIAADALTWGLKTSAVGETANILVQAPNGTPEPTVRACTTEKYGRVWDAPLYSALQNTIIDKDARWTTPPTWTGEPAGVYRGDRDSFVILTNGGSIVTDPSAINRGNSSTGADSGTMFRGLLIRNSEVGAASVTIDQILFRAICGNHMLWGAVMDKAYRRRHIGTNTLRDVVSEIMRIAFNWTNATASRDEAIIRSLIANEIAHTRDGVIDELRKIGASKEQAEQAYATCERSEEISPRSFWGVAQGFTRNSQETGYQDDRFELDQLAAKVLSRGARLVKV